MKYAGMLPSPSKKMQELKLEVEALNKAKMSHNQSVSPVAIATPSPLNAYKQQPRVVYPGISSGNEAIQIAVEPKMGVPPVQPSITPKPNKVHESYIDRGLSSYERSILKETSTINGTQFLPWIQLDGIVKDTTDFLDSYDYQLTLRHKRKGAQFVQPIDLYGNCSVVNYPIDPNCVRQNCVADCTIISSMISCANHEMRFKKPLISGIIFPQANDRPIYNALGRYIVKLYFNGVPRRVEIDHRVLVDQSKSELCTYSKNQGELWPTLIEKAFLKVHGGYKYDGGNGSQDTYSLTGWIPEYIPFENNEPFAQWKKISSAFKWEIECE